MMSVLFILSFILNSMGTITITYLVYYLYKYNARSLLFLIVSLLGLLCSGVSYSFYIVNLGSVPFNQFRSMFLLFFSLGNISFTVFFYLFLTKKFMLRTHKLEFQLLFSFYLASVVCSIIAVIFPIIWYASLIINLVAFLVSAFVAYNQLVFLQSKLQFEKQDIFFKLLNISFLILSISIVSELIYFYFHEKISSFSLFLYFITPLFFFLVLRNQSLYYQKQEIENPEKIKTIFTQFNLSSKEQEIAMEVLQGKSNKEIAYDMDISNSTVKSHIYSIYKKVNVQSRVQFVNLVMLRM
ncbi:MAG: helix-turn-helix transcriptional regulator [Spirochaetales bacterium]|nr:helix-turn-helix transcriptional regulator [Spirochaetales bacterium]